jgi:hypothetical protein
MSIDKSRKWWVGTKAEDIEEYLNAYSTDNYKISEFRLSLCSCGSNVFHLYADDDEGCAKRTCTACNKEEFICDSEEYWTEASPEQWKCVDCYSLNANIGVGFSLYEDGEVRWLYVGERCQRCGILGCFAGWKVAYSPSKQLLDQV